MEILVVVAVLGIIFSITLPQFSKVRENQVLKNAVSDVLSSLNKAQSKTLASLDSSSYGVHFDSDKVIIFKGTTFSSGNVNNETINIVSPAIISSVTLLPSGGVDLYFNRLSGTPNVTGEIVVSSTNYWKVVTISGTGAISVD